MKASGEPGSYPVMTLSIGQGDKALQMPLTPLLFATILEEIVLSGLRVTTKAAPSGRPTRLTSSG